MKKVSIVSATRTAIGGFGESLKNKTPSELATETAKAAIEQSGIEAEKFGHSVWGNVIPTDSRDTYLARVAAINAGLPETVPAITVNRLCSSGLQAIISGAQQIQLGLTEAVLTGGAESMSRAPYTIPSARFGARLGDGQLVDSLVNALHCPFNHYHMGITAENVAEKYGISRSQQDELALESHHKAQNAITKGYFENQIIAIDVGKRGKTVMFDTDEHVRFNCSIEDLQKLRPAFKKDGSVTAGNASGLNDAAASLVLAEADYAQDAKLKVLANIVDYSVVGVSPSIMGIGPVPAIQVLLERNGLSATDVDVYEVNEAFAAQAAAVIQELGLPAERVNPNGSGISLGHPIGATGAIIATKAVHELQRIQGRYAIVSLCVGGGQGVAMLIERPE